MKNLTSKILVLSLLLLAGCQRSSFDAAKALSAAQPVNLELPSLDFSTMSVSSNNVADGLTPATVTISIRDGNNQPVEGATMAIVVSGNDNVIVPCTTSNIYGMLYCRVYTTQSGVKKISASGGITLWVNATFAAPTPTRVLFGVVSAGGSLQGSGGQKIIATAGIVESTLQLRDSTNVIRVVTSALAPIIGN